MGRPYRPGAGDAYRSGLGPGDKVALLSSNMPNWCVSYLAVTSAGMVAVPILPVFSTEELEMIIAHSEAKALMVPTSSSLNWRSPR